MKVIILYRLLSDHARKVEEFAHDIERQQNVTPELINADTPEGSEMQKLYDITNFPAVLALRNDGQLMQLWAGEQLPLMGEVAAFVKS